MSSLVFDLIGRDLSASAALRKFGAEAEATGSRAGRAFTKLSAGMVAAGVVVAAVSVKMAADFQAQTTRLVTAAGESEGNLKKVSAGILAVAESTGTSTKQLTDGMYMIESAGFHGAEGLNVLKAAAQGAKVEGADMGSVANALTTVMKDMHAPASQAANVMSQMVTAVGQGKMRMDDLAGSIHSVLPNAAALHMSFGQVAGALATMTAQGISADQAAQNLNHTIVKIAAPTVGMTKAMASYGLSSADLAKNLGKNGLTGTMDILSKAIMNHMGPAGTTLRSAFETSQAAAHAANREFANLPPAAQKIADAVNKGSISLGGYRHELKALPADQASLLQQWKASRDGADGFSAALKSGGQDAQTYTAAMKSMLGDQTGLQVALHLSGGATADFNSAVKKISASTAEAGGNVKDWATVSETMNVKMARLKETGQVLAIKLGTDLLPAVSSLASGMLKLIGFFETHAAAAKALGIALGVVLVVAIGRVVTAWVAANVAFLATPIGATIGAIAVVAGLAAAAFGLFGKKAHEQVKPVAELTQAIEADSGALGVNTRAQIVSSLNQKGLYDSGLKLGIGQRQLTDAVMGNQKAMNAIIPKLNAAALQHGHLTDQQKAEKQAAEALINALPNLQAQLAASKNAAHNAAVATGATVEQMNRLQVSVNKVPSLKHMKVTLDNYANVQAQIAQLVARRALIIDASVRTAPGAPAIGGHNAVNALGTDHFVGGRTWISENGPELVELPAGSKVKSAAATRDAVTRAARSGGGNTYITVAVPSTFGPAAAEEAAREIGSALERLNNRGVKFNIG